MSLHKKDMGSVGEALVVAQILEHGHSAFIDFGDNSSIDIIAETDTKQLQRIQVKTVSRSELSPECSKLLLYKNGPNYRFKYEVDDVDWFAMVDYVTKNIAWINATDILSEGLEKLH